MTLRNALWHMSEARPRSPHWRRCPHDMRSAEAALRQLGAERREDVPVGKFMFAGDICHTHLPVIFVMCS